MWDSFLRKVQKKEGKGKAFPVLNKISLHEDILKDWRYTPRILNLGVRWR
jgi:hypothetical protein